MNQWMTYPTLSYITRVIGEMFLLYGIVIMQNITEYVLGLVFIWFAGVSVRIEERGEVMENLRFLGSSLKSI